MTVYLVISQPQIPYVHRIYMVLANPIYVQKACRHHRVSDASLKNAEGRMLAKNVAASWVWVWVWVRGGLQEIQFVRRHHTGALGKHQALKCIDMQAYLRRRLII
jgi:hypothetical protein